MMVKFSIIAWVLLQVLIFLVLLLLSWFVYDRRYRRNDHSSANRLRETGFTATNEIFIDPKDGHKYRVYYNSRTGEREYVREDDEHRTD